jgi:hypothetical protein
MAEPELREKTILGCAENLERVSMVLKDIGMAISEHYPGLSLIVGDYCNIIDDEASFLREY